MTNNLTSTLDSDQVDLTRLKNLRVGIIQWDKGDGLAAMYAQTMTDLGCEPVEFMYNAPLPSSLDIVIVFGPFGSLVPIIRQLLMQPAANRPVLTYWMTEQLPNPDLPEWFRYGVGQVRSKIEQWAFQPDQQGYWQPHPILGKLITKAHRYRYYGDLYWLRRLGLLTTLVIPSAWTGKFLQARGFDSIDPPPGYRSDWGRDLGLERDIPVLWIGKVGSSRRGRLLQQLRSDIKVVGIDLLMIDGEENPYVFGEERTRLLNRTKIMVNLLREEWDDNSMRFSLAAHNHALVITEPTLSHSDFVPGEHLVETPIERLAETICYYLTHETERKRITDQAYQLISQNSREQIIGEILVKSIAKAQAVRPTSFANNTPSDDEKTSL